MTSKITNIHDNQQPAGFPPAPSEAHQRAAGGAGRPIDDGAVLEAWNAFRTARILARLTRAVEAVEVMA